MKGELDTNRLKIEIKNIIMLYLHSNLKKMKNQKNIQVKIALMLSKIKKYIIYYLTKKDNEKANYLKNQLKENKPIEDYENDFRHYEKEHNC